MTYADDDTIIPATYKLHSGTVVNPYDVDVFWRVMVLLFGDSCRLLARPDGAATLRALRDIRENYEWVTFTRLYFDTLAMVDEVLWAQPAQVVHAFDAVGPERSHQFVLRKI